MYWDIVGSEKHNIGYVFIDGTCDTEQDVSRLDTTIKCLKERMPVILVRRETETSYTIHILSPSDKTSVTTYKNVSQEVYDTFHRKLFTPSS